LIGSVFLQLREIEIERERQRQRQRQRVECWSG